MGQYQGYEKYKDSGFEWLGEIPAHWETCKLKRTVNIFGRIGFRGYTIQDIVSEDEGAITLSPSNIFDRKINYSNRTYLSWDKYYESPEIQVFNEDIIFVKTGSTIGKVAIVKNMPEPMTINPQLVVLKEISCHSEFLAYLMNADFYQFQVKGFCFGGSTPAMTQENLGQTEVVLPPLEEQETIAQFLDYKTSQIDALIAKKESLLEKLDEKRTALISHAVTKGLDPTVPMKDSGIEWLGEIPAHWQQKRLKYVASITRGAILRPVNEPSYFDENGEWYYLNISDVTKCERFLYSAELKLSDLGSCKSARILPNNLILTASATIGKPIINKVKVCIHDGFIAFKDMSVNIFYLFYILLDQNIYSAMGKTNTQKNIYLDEVKNVTIGIPTLKEQQKIVKYLDKQTTEIDQQKAKIQQAIDLLKEYRTALITNAVTGKIDVRQVLQ